MDRETHQLVGAGIGPVVVGSLGPGELEGAGTHQQGAQDGSVVRVGDQRLAIVVAAGVAHQVLDDLGQPLFVQGQPDPQVLSQWLSRFSLAKYQ